MSGITGPEIPSGMEIGKVPEEPISKNVDNR